MIKKYAVQIAFTEPLLASSPASKEVYSQYIASRERKESEDRGDEVESLPAAEIEKIGSSVFHLDETGVFLFDYHIRGFLKEAASAVTGKPAKAKKPDAPEIAPADKEGVPVGMAAHKSKIDRFVFVFPRRLYLSINGENITKAAEVEERPVRAMTPLGPRVALKKSEKIPIGAGLRFEIHVLPLAQREITEQRIREWLEYGAYSGLGEWRTGSFGRFSFTLEAIS